IQSGILTIMLIITCITFLSYNTMHLDKVIKIFFAPFLSLVPLIFVLTVIKDWIQKFSEQEFSKKEIIKYSVITLVVAVGFTFLTKFISSVTATEIMIAIMIAIMSMISFISIKVRDIMGMSLLTGVGEGIIAYMVFIF
ncbi:MAG: hypothetical protein IAF38_19700, partial [Bacteroidia bacterium]|nr:hypothetical protein [Bacteroidia bacterium]